MPGLWVVVARHAGPVRSRPCTSPEAYRLARSGRIDRSNLGPTGFGVVGPKRDAAVGSDDNATYSSAIEANRPLRAVLRPDSLSHGRGGEHSGGGSRYAGILLERQRTDSVRQLTRALF
jgi:hypothetical protein